MIIIQSTRKPKLFEIKEAAKACGKSRNLECFLKLRELNETCASAAKFLGVEGGYVGKKIKSTKALIDEALSGYCL